MKVICIKEFTYQDRTYLKNEKYELVDYLRNYFFVSIIPKIYNSAYPAYPIDRKYRYCFMTLMELRKLKLKKINESNLH